MSTQTKVTHTPGPWDYLNRNIIGWETGEYICEMAGSASNPYHQADARLIAAAPELLEMVTRLSDFMATGRAHTPAAIQAVADADALRMRIDGEVL